MDYISETINGHEVEIAAGGELCVKEGCIWVDKLKCSICYEEKICLGFDTSAHKSGQINICMTCINEILQKKYKDWLCNLKFDKHGNLIEDKT